MNLTDIQGKRYPQKVILDSNIQTVTGELFAAGTEITVFLCEKLIRCRDCRDYCNVNGPTGQSVQESEGTFLNPACDEHFLDTHCNGEVYETVDDLCRECPRYFSCESEFFTICNNDRAVKIGQGYEFELKEIKSIRNTSNVVSCHCTNVGCDLQISSNVISKFRAIEDQTHYKPSELLNRFPLPRQVDFMDENIQKLGFPHLTSTEISIESEQTMCSLLFTVDYQISELESGLEVRHRIKCCELIDPLLVKIKQKIDNSQIGERFDTVFVLESHVDKRPVFSLLGKKHKTVISRIKAGRQHYLDMYPGDHGDKFPSVDSGFTECDVASTSKTKSSPSNVSFNSVAEKQDQEDDRQSVCPAIPPRRPISPRRDDGNYVDIKNKDSTPPLPERLYQEGEQQNQENCVTMPGGDKHKFELPSQLRSQEHEAPKPTEDISSNNTVVSKPIIPASEKDTNNITETSNSAISNTDLVDMTSNEIASLLRKCKLSGFADKCLDEGIDGDLFFDLTDEILKDEPFCLKPLEILKVHKLKTGWKPK